MTTSSHKKLSIALIEDDPDISALYQQRFEMEGDFTIKTANNGEEGLALLKTYHPDIVLLDMMMPKMSGLETLKHLRALPDGNKLKVIALTNMNDPDTVAAVKELGVTHHIVKANTPASELVDTVRKASAPE